MTIDIIRPHSLLDTDWFVGVAGCANQDHDLHVSLSCNMLQKTPSNICSGACKIGSIAGSATNYNLS